MKKTVCTIIILILFLSAVGQHKFGIKLNGGVSQIHRTEENNSAYKTHFKLSAGSGVYYNFGFGKNSYIGIDVAIIRIQGHEHFESTQTFNEFNGTIFIPVVMNNQFEYYRKLYYLGLPLYYGLKFKKVSINIGGQISVVIKNKFIWQGSSQYSDGRNPYSHTSNEIELGTGKFDLGGRVGLTYNVTEKIGLNGNYYIGKNKIDKSRNYPSEKELIQQITIGINYNFSKKKSAE